MSKKQDLEDFDRFMGGLTDEQRCFWCEGYKQAMLTKNKETNKPKDKDEDWVLIVAGAMLGLIWLWSFVTLVFSLEV